MIFEQVPNGGCQSYLLGCSSTHAAIVIDPNLHQIDHYLALAAKHGLRIRYVLDTHTHADHFSAAKELGQRLNTHVVTHPLSPAPYAEFFLADGETLKVGDLTLQALHTPGHTRDSMCLVMEDRLFTGDTLLIGGAGRTDLPTGDAHALYDSLFHRVLKLDPKLTIHPAHDYNNRGHSTLGEEIAANPRLQKRDRESFVAMMRELNLEMPAHLTEALRTNMNGGKPVCQLLAEAAGRTEFVSVETAAADDALVLDVREHEAFAAGHIPGALNLPRGQLEWQVDRQLPDPNRRILVCCGNGEMATLAAATLRELGFARAAVLKGGLKAWQDQGFPLSHA
ncbi:MAG TPA: MBL fold metallo-hydrolase [Rhizomicrobium sp.]|jgi:glyoxylase-like metal-dependent hydrolase (beta-lactamase superfamily II)|nr:MBL fold metallo-hydrolase [Rhizomicrobium sp.]